MSDVGTSAPKVYEGYLNVPDEYVQELGKLVVVAGNTEWLAHHFLECLAVEVKPNPDWKTLRTAARTRVENDGTPECASATPDEVVAWFTAGQQVMQHRNRIFHAHHYIQGDRPIAVNIRTRAGWQTDELAEVVAVREQIAGVHRDGIHLLIRLLHPIGGGSYHSHYLSANARAYMTETERSGGRDAVWAMYPKCVETTAQLKARLEITA